MCGCFKIFCCCFLPPEESSKPEQYKDVQYTKEEIDELLLALTNIPHHHVRASQHFPGWMSIFLTPDPSPRTTKNIEKSVIEGIKNEQRG